MASDKQQGFSVQTLTDVVRGQIAYPEAPMPANLYQGQNARDIAAYVAKCAADPHCGVTATKEAAGPTSTSTSTSATTTTSTSGGGGAAAEGKHIFLTVGCSSCHTLKAAGSHGTVGPNLDALKPSETLVAHQVETGGAIMPSFKSQLTPAQITAVATFVSSSAGK